MEYINKKFQLFFGTKSGLIEINDELYKNLKNQINHLFQKTQKYSYQVAHFSK